MVLPQHADPEGDNSIVEVAPMAGTSSSSIEVQQIKGNKVKIIGIELRGERLR